MASLKHIRDAIKQHKLILFKYDAVSLFSSEFSISISTNTCDIYGKDTLKSLSIFYINAYVRDHSSVYSLCNTAYSTATLPKGFHKTNIVTEEKLF